MVDNIPMANTQKIANEQKLHRYKVSKLKKYKDLSLQPGLVWWQPFFVDTQ